MRPRGTLIVGIVVLGVLCLATGWYIFRPERAFLNRLVDEPAPGNFPLVLVSGQFVPHAHAGRGRVEVLELADRQRIVRLSEFETRDGPDLALYLLGSSDATRRQDLDTVGYLSLRPLKGNVGAQNYPVPDSADLGRYHAVAVWCRRFGVNFTAAPLTTP